MKSVRVLMALVMMITLHTLEGYSAVPDVFNVMVESKTANTVTTQNTPWYQNNMFQSFSFSSGFAPAGAASELVTWVNNLEGVSLIDEAPAGAGNVTGAGSEVDQIVDGVELDVEGAQSGGFWTRERITRAGGALLVTGLVVGLLMLFLGGGSGGGSGSGSGSGGSEGGGGSGGGGAGGGLLLGGGGGTEGGGTGPFGGSYPGPIPANPEPSTLILMGLGLLLPFLRKKNQ